MANGVETRGQVARTMAGTEGVEIKATIPEKQVDLALQAYGLSLNDNDRYIYFFDTPDLELFETGVIARARRIVGGQHDSTIKFRPVEPESVPTLWGQVQRFQDRGRLLRKGRREVRITHNARGQGADQAGGCGEKPSCQPVHRGTTAIPA